MRTLNIPTRIHGRVLVRDVSDPTVVVIGFHGYMENAGIQMERLQALPGSERWTLISVQGLHRFYRGRSEDVVAGWMTRQDREAMIDDNIEYADRVIEAAAPADVPLVTTGFSQGVAMAFRYGIRGTRRAHGVAAVGGDIPPELLVDRAVDFPAVLLARGERDEWYTAVKLASDADALRARGARVQPLVYDAGHEWTADAGSAVAAFIRLASEPRGIAPQ